MNETFVGKIAAWVRLSHREVERYSVAVSDRTRTGRGHPRSTPDRRADGSADHPPDGPHDVPRGGLIQAAFSRAPPPFARVARATCTACFRVLVLARDIAWDSSRSSARSSASMRALSTRAPTITDPGFRRRRSTLRRLSGAAFDSLVTLPLCVPRRVFAAHAVARSPSAARYPRARRGHRCPGRAAWPAAFTHPQRPLAPCTRFGGLVAQRPRQSKRMALWGRLSGLWGAAFGRPATLGQAEGRGRFSQAPPRSGGGSDDKRNAAVAAGRRRGVEGVAKPNPSTILRPKGFCGTHQCSNGVAHLQINNLTSRPGNSNASHGSLH